MGRDGQWNKLMTGKKVYPAKNDSFILIILCAKRYLYQQSRCHKPFIL